MKKSILIFTMFFIVEITPCLAAGLLVYFDARDSRAVTVTEFGWIREGRGFSTAYSNGAVVKSFYPESVLAIVEYPPEKPAANLEADANQNIRTAQAMMAQYPQHKAWFAAAIAKWQLAVAANRQRSVVAAAATPQAIAPTTTTRASSTPSPVTMEPPRTPDTVEKPVAVSVNEDNAASDPKDVEWLRQRRCAEGLLATARAINVSQKAIFQYTQVFKQIDQKMGGTGGLGVYRQAQNAAITGAAMSQTSRDKGTTILADQNVAILAAAQIESGAANSWVGKTTTSILSTLSRMSPDQMVAYQIKGFVGNGSVFQKQLVAAYARGDANEIGRLQTVIDRGAPLEGPGNQEILQRRSQNLTQEDTDRATGALAAGGADFGKAQMGSALDFLAHSMAGLKGYGNLVHQLGDEAGIRKNLLSRIGSKSDIRDAAHIEEIRKGFMKDNSWFGGSAKELDAYLGAVSAQFDDEFLNALTDAGVHSVEVSLISQTAAFQAKVREVEKTQRQEEISQMLRAATSRMMLDRIDMSDMLAIAAEELKGDPLNYKKIKDLYDNDGKADSRKVMDALDAMGETGKNILKQVYLHNKK